MSISSAELRIRSYSDEQLTGIQDQIRRKSLRVVKTAINTGIIGSLGPVRVLSVILDFAQGQEFAVRPILERDMADFIAMNRTLDQLDILSDIDSKLNSEMEWRKVRERFEGAFRDE